MTENVINHIKNCLQNTYPSGEIRSLTRRILLYVCGREPYEFLADESLRPSQSELCSINRIIERLLKWEPIQYITGETTFYGCSIHVNRSTFIPRPETEELTDRIVTELTGLPDIADRRLRILDICTGSGCIAVALARFVPGSSVTAVDISADALRTASVNAERNGVEIEFVEADIREHYRDLTPLFSAPFDLIVSNPPYILRTERQYMRPNVTMYEPAIALFVYPFEPLQFHGDIARFGKVMLNPGGALWLEINEKFGRSTVGYLSRIGYETLELMRDLSGKERFVKAML